MNKTIFVVQVINLILLAILIVSMSVYIWSNSFVEQIADIVELSIALLIFVNILHSIFSMISIKKN